jgi:hypothetical protein
MVPGIAPILLLPSVLRLITNYQLTIKKVLLHGAITMAPHPLATHGVPGLITNYELTIKKVLLHGTITKSPPSSCCPWVSLG